MFILIVPLPNKCNCVVPSPNVTYEFVTLVGLVKSASWPDMCLVAPVSNIIRVDMLFGYATLLYFKMFAIIFVDGNVLLNFSIQLRVVV